MKVIFRKFKDDDSVIALFPGEQWDFNGNITSYMHHGQHGGACPSLLKESSNNPTVPANATEYEPLLNELINQIGYPGLTVLKTRGE